CIDSVGEFGRLAVLMASSSATALQCPATWKPAAAVTPPPATDDYPFLYLQARTIPDFYLLTLALILGSALLLVRLSAGTLRPMGRYLDLFCMGAAFLLLETKNVVQFALLFGTTWFVNALVFTGVLLSVWLAIETARRMKLPPPQVLYLGLFAALVVAWAVPQSSLLALSPVPRFFAAVAIAFAPIYLANLVFSQRFAAVGSSSVAFAANLLGALAGGALEYLSLVTG